MGKLRRINQGTRYDISGQLRKEVRAIERAANGEYMDVVLISRKRNQKGRIWVQVSHWGGSPQETAHWMVATAKNRLEPA